MSVLIRSYLTLSTLRAGFRIGSVLMPAATVRRACAMFTTPLPGTRSRALRAPLGDAQCGGFELDGRRIATYVWGDPRARPYVLFAHGWSSYGTSFLPWVERLRQAGYAVVSFDQTGHGRSGGLRTTLPGFVRTLAAVAARFGAPAALVGHSLGGAALTVALARGLDAQRAILIAPSADLADATLRFTRFVRLPERLYRRMLAAFENIGVHFDELQAQRNAPRISRPALIVHDIEDREIPWAEGERYARYWPDSRLLTTRGLSHHRIAQDPAVIDAALAFLRGETVGERIVSSPNLPYGL